MASRDGLLPRRKPGKPSPEVVALWIVSGIVCLLAVAALIVWLASGRDDADDRCSRLRVSMFVGVSNLTTIVPPSDVFDTNVDDYPYDTWSSSEGAAARLHRNSEVEPGLAFDPRNPNKIIVTFQQDRWSNGGSRGIGSRYSTDGGRSWQKGNLKSTRFDGHPNLLVTRATDTWISCGSDGVCFTSVEQIDTDGYINITVARTLDQGKTWSLPAVLSSSSLAYQPCYGPDKNTLLVDPFDTDYVYLTVQNYDFCDGISVQFVRSSDAGVTWEPVVVVQQYPAPDLTDPYGLIDWANAAQMVSPEPGVLVLCWLRQRPFIYIIGYQNGDSSWIVCKRSFDRGTTWEAEEIVAVHTYVGQQYPPDNPWQGFTMVDYEMNAPVRDGGGVFSMALSPRTGRIYLTVADSRYKPDRFYSPLIVMSKDSGATWGEAVPVAPTRLSAQAGTATVAVLDDGRVGVLYYTDANDVSGDSIKSVDLYLSLLDADLTHLLDDVRVTPESFDVRQGARAYGPMMGDYAQLVSYGSGFYAAFATFNNLGLPPLVEPVSENVVVAEDRSSIRFARIDFSDDECFDAVELARFRDIARPDVVADGPPGFFPPPCPTCVYTPEFCPMCNASNLVPPPPPYDFEHGVAALNRKFVD